MSSSSTAMVPRLEEESDTIDRPRHGFRTRGSTDFFGNSHRDFYGESLAQPVKQMGSWTYSTRNQITLIESTLDVASTEVTEASAGLDYRTHRTSLEVNNAIDRVAGAVHEGNDSWPARVQRAPSTRAANTFPRESASQLLAEWHGQVTEVYETTFEAQLQGRHGDGVLGKEDVAIIPRIEVRPDDEDLLVPGGFFSLCVSYEISRKGRRRYTEVVFRRMPAYRREELEQAEVRGHEIARGLRLE